MHILIICFFVYSFPAYSQEHRLFHDDFSAQTNRWETHSTQGGRAELNHGQLLITGRGGYTKCLHEVLMSNGKDFSLKTRFTFQSGPPPDAFGILWSGGDRMDHYFAFLIRPEGYFAVVDVYKGKEEMVIPWNRFRKIRGLGEENELQIIKTGWKLSFQINGKEVADTRFKKLYGKYHGFILRGNGSVSVDEFSIYHPPVSINQMEGNYSIASKRLLDSTVNSPDFDETDPWLAPDHRTLYFTRKPVGADWNQGNIWMSRVQGDSMWGEPVNMFPFNNEGRNAVAHISQDERRVLLSSQYEYDGKHRGPGISLSVKNSEGAWKNPVNMIVKGLETEEEPVTCFLSKDEKILLMSMEKKEGYGDLDIYVSFNQDGNWTTPKNLGPDVNTFGMEFSPFLDEDGETLYFSSSGHPGYGKTDVYMSKRTSNTWSQWTTPKNLGPRVNGFEWDGFYTPIRKDIHAYMASRDPVHGDLVLYGVRIPRDMSTQPVVRIYGRVLHKQTRQPLGGLITFKGLGEDSVAKQTRSSEDYGTYNMYLPFGEAYQLFAEKIGYFAQMDTLDLRRYSHYRELRKDLYLSPIEVGQTITLNRVFFKRARAELLADSYPELDRLVLLMRSIPSLKIEIRGHTDNLGEEAELQQLSERRAEVVKNYLVERRIAANRITSAGFGGSMPIASNVNPATRRLNRRVEFLIISR